MPSGTPLTWLRIPLPYLQAPVPSQPTPVKSRPVVRSTGCGGPRSDLADDIWSISSYAECFVEWT